MRVTVLLFGRLHDLAGLREVACEVPSGATVAAVWQAVTGRFPAVAPHARSVSAAVNAGAKRIHAGFLSTIDDSCSEPVPAYKSSLRLIVNVRFFKSP